MPDAVVSELPQDLPPATMDSMGQLLLLLFLAFLGTLLLLWLVILLARFVQRHAAKKAQPPPGQDPPAPREGEAP